MSQVAAAQAELLQIEQKRLQNAITHLCSSIVALKAELAAGPGDSELKAAVSEDLLLIAKYRARVESLRLEIQALSGGRGAAPPPNAPPAAGAVAIEVDALDPVEQGVWL